MQRNGRSRHRNQLDRDCGRSGRRALARRWSASSRRPRDRRRWRTFEGPNSLGIGASYRSLPTSVNRYLIPSREITPEPVTREHWSGRYRIGITPCGNDLTYVYQVCPEWDKAATAMPSNVALWSRAFPRLRREIEFLSQSGASRHNFSIVRCPRWQKGRVAIVGDAAHGLPPTLGQGVGLTLMNARALAVVLGRKPNRGRGLTGLGIGGSLRQRQDPALGDALRLFHAPVANTTLVPSARDYLGIPFCPGTQQAHADCRSRLEVDGDGTSHSCSSQTLKSGPPQKSKVAQPARFVHSVIPTTHESAASARSRL